MEGLIKKFLIVFSCFVIVVICYFRIEKENIRLKKEIENQQMLIEILERTCECACEYE